MADFAVAVAVFAVFDATFKVDSVSPSSSNVIAVDLSSVKCSAGFGMVVPRTTMGGLKVGKASENSACEIAG